jgi:hypothetical protein
MRPTNLSRSLIGLSRPNSRVNVIGHDHPGVDVGVARAELLNHLPHRAGVGLGVQAPGFRGAIQHQRDVVVVHQQQRGERCRRASTALARTGSVAKPAGITAISGSTSRNCCAYWPRVALGHHQVLHAVARGANHDAFRKRPQHVQPQVVHALVVGAGGRDGFLGGDGREAVADHEPFGAGFAGGPRRSGAGCSRRTTRPRGRQSRVLHALRQEAQSVAAAACSPRAA